MSALESFGARLATRCALFLAVLSLGCGGDSPPTGPGPGPPPATQLGFTAVPATAERAGTFSVDVAIQDASGGTVSSATNAVTVALGTNPGGAALSGTTTLSAVTGVARFTDLSLDEIGTGYTLNVASGALTGATSTAFDAVFTYGTVTAANPFTCALQVTGLAYCWGGNTLGQFGDGTQFSSPEPVAVSGGPVLRFLNTGETVTCGITTTDETFCWGHNNEGQLGDGTQQFQTVPTPVAGGLSFASVDPGSSHTCGLTTSGAAYCWGDNTYGQLGDSTEVDRLTPVAVSGGLTFTALSTGWRHTCGVTSDGAAYCWGTNAQGELGTGAQTFDPVTVPVAVSGGLDVASVTAGSFYTCALTSAGTAHCWGDGVSGQLGDGMNDNAVTEPRPVLGDLVFSSIDAFWMHTCGITTGSVAYCWGNNLDGQVGDGTQQSRNVPTLVTGGHEFAVVSVGGFHSCGVTSGGSAYCWGANQSGELGDGTIGNRQLTPVSVKIPN